MTDLITRNQAAERLKISSRSVDRLIQAGDLPAIRISPRAVRIKSQDLENLISLRFGSNAS